MRPRSRCTKVVTTFILTALLGYQVKSLASVAITTNTGLGFGQIVSTSIAGTVKVTPAGFRSASGGIALGNGFGVSAASFTVTGEPDRSYSIMLPSSISLTAGENTMTVDTFTSVPSGSGNLGPGGTQQVWVGATLRVGAAQSAASYSGTYPVTVTYE